MPVLLRTLLFTAIVPGTVAGWLPWWFVHRAGDAGLAGAHVELGPLRHAGWLLAAAGACGYLRCALNFTFRGDGTPSPLDPPRKFVATGLYRHVRNPMYVAIGALLVGESLLYQSPLLLAWPAVLFPTFHLFVVLHEEPTLRARFGESYAAYRRAVPRWLPRWRPWDATAQ